jgi:hypothetical protein
VRPPCQAGDLVNGGGISGGCGCGGELFGEHSFSVRDQVPPKGAHDFRQSSATAQNGHLQRFRFSGSIRTATSLDIPRLCRTPARLTKAGFVFSGFRSPNRRESPAEGFSLFAIRVNVPALCLASLRALRALRALRRLRDFGEQSRRRSYFGRNVKTDENPRPLHPSEPNSHP